MTEFGEWIRRHRTAQGLSQTQCALLARMKVQQWNRMEKRVGRPEYETLCTVADVLRVPLEEVLRAAEYPILAPEADSVRIARQIEPHLLQVPAEKRRAAERAFIESAKQISELLTA